MLICINCIGYRGVNISITENTNFATHKIHRSIIWSFIIRESNSFYNTGNEKGSSASDYEINLESRTAFCTICGYTDIFIFNTRTRKTPRITCIARARELREKSKERDDELRVARRAMPNWNQRHSLTEIDTEVMTANCTVCGLTDIWKDSNKGKVRYVCATKWRDYMRQYKRNHYTGRASNPHALSNIDEENQTAVCAKCGTVRIEIHYGKRKITRRCINAGKEPAKTQPTRKKVKKAESPAS